MTAGRAIQAGNFRPVFPKPGSLRTLAKPNFETGSLPEFEIQPKNRLEPGSGPARKNLKVQKYLIKAFLQNKKIQFGIIKSDGINDEEIFYFSL